MAANVVTSEELDTEWIELILEALHTGLTAEEIKNFLQSN
jgi:hypothetical protein